MRALALVMASIVAGCSTAPVLVTGPTTVRVEIPVAVPCIAAADIPPRPVLVRVDPARASREQIAAATAANSIALRDYATRADAALKSCAGAAQ